MHPKSHNEVGSDGGVPWTQRFLFDISACRTVDTGKDLANWNHKARLDHVTTHAKRTNPYCCCCWRTGQEATLSRGYGSARSDRCLANVAAPMAQGSSGGLRVAQTRGSPRSECNHAQPHTRCNQPGTIGQAYRDKARSNVWKRTRTRKQANTHTDTQRHTASKACNHKYNV